MCSYSRKVKVEAKEGVLMCLFPDKSRRLTREGANKGFWTDT